MRHLLEEQVGSEGGMEEITPEQLLSMEDSRHELIDGELTVPVIGAANASALAGGFELLLGCDIIVASSQAMFGLPEVKRGLIPAGSGTLLGTRIPLAIALEMTLTGDSIDADPHDGEDGQRRRNESQTHRVSPFQAFPSDCRDVEPRAGIHVCDNIPIRPRGGINSA